ncbi:hypothetical protein KOR42_47670 [Thalassoglobus neptunius]|uniref:Uncharacterized protein n=1 Tax=Thalassoglobus neptunius TaxID=1938619 RepID=A0A5C5VS83_9PLAN|nr:hypothetical protein [Thalassoglobus neptunius]TWT41496.1 hypothetical protein KOR42_47670 [Thalassoglobus neptunius]
MTIAENSGTNEFGGFGQRLRHRLEPGQGARPDRPSDPTWTIQRKLSMNATTLALLEKVAQAISTDERRVSPMQIAALLIEDATHGLAEHLKEN